MTERRHDTELKALKTVVEALDSLDPEALTRTLAYIQSRFQTTEPTRTVDGVGGAER